jgi:hypothetical protein
MCVVIHTPDGGEVETMGRLRALWPRGLVTDYRWGDLDLNDPEMAGPDADTCICICPVDVEASARLTGAEVARTDRGDWRLVSSGTEA